MQSLGAPANASIGNRDGFDEHLDFSLCQPRASNTLGAVNDSGYISKLFRTDR
jgi:hypothetical protein